MLIYLLLSQKLCVHHLDLNGNQRERLKCQTPPVSVVVLHKEYKEHTVAHDKCFSYLKHIH